MSNDFCFCTLALKKRYRDWARLLAGDIEKYFPGAKHVIATDKPSAFKACTNVVAIKHSQRGLFYPVNDKRFAVKEALLRYETAISIDADSRIIQSPTLSFQFLPGNMPRGHSIQDILTRHHSSRDQQIVKELSKKLQINLEKVKWNLDWLFIVTRDKGKESEFIKWWGVIAEYLELHRFSGGDGYCIGLAASKVGWEGRGDIGELARIFHNTKNSRSERAFSLRGLKLRLGYYYRYSKARLFALRDYDFFYR